jgi:hypothetical protein
MSRFLSRTYQFQSTWHVPAPKSSVEPIIEDVVSWPSWWQGVESATLLEKTDSYEGSIAMLCYRAPLGYLLQLHITITQHVQGELLAFTSTGDLEGNGSWSFEEKDGNTMMVILWNVKTTKLWMNVAALFLKPLFVHGHHKVMSDGERGLLARVAGDKDTF